MIVLGVPVETFVLTFDGRYVKFGSYRGVRLVDNPLKASLYSTRALAAKRLEDSHVWIPGEDGPTGTGELEIHKLKFQMVDDEDVS